MELELPHVVARESMVLLGMVVFPFVGGLLGVGLIVGVLQAMTQVHDPAVGFLPRMLTVMLLVTWFGGDVLERLAALFSSSVLRMAGG